MSESRVNRINVIGQLRGTKIELTMRHIQVFFLMWHTQEGGQAAAGQMIGVSQAAISNAVKSLEQICGFQLFQRGPNQHSKPTNAAIRMYPHFDRAFRAMTDLTIEIEAARPNPDHGLPFKRFNAQLTPLDKQSTAADSLAELIRGRGESRKD